MTYLTRFKANLAAGSAFSSDKIKKRVLVEPKGGKPAEDKTVINWKAIFVEPNTAQGVVAVAIMAPFAILAAPLAIPLAMLGGWATNEEGPDEKKSYKHPIMAGVALVTLALPVVAAFAAIRLVVTPFTELANLAKSAYKAATSKGSDTAKLPKYDASQISSKAFDIAKHVWTLGLLLLVPAIKRLVTLDGQIEGLKDRLAVINAKKKERMSELRKHYHKLQGDLCDLQRSESLDTTAIKKAEGALTAFEAKIGKEKSSFDAELSGIRDKIKAKEKALYDKKDKRQAKETNESKSQSLGESASPLPASASPSEAPAPSCVDGSDGEWQELSKTPGFTPMSDSKSRLDKDTKPETVVAAVTPEPLVVSSAPSVGLST